MKTLDIAHLQDIIDNIRDDYVEAIDFCTVSEVETYRIDILNNVGA